MEAKVTCCVDKTLILISTGGVVLMLALYETTLRIECV